MFFDQEDGTFEHAADLIDLVFPQRIVGPDDEYGTDDDSTRFLTLLNTTPLRPVRCEP